MRLLTKISFILFLLVTIAVNGIAQNPDIKRTTHWYFGYGAGLDFSSGTPVVDTNSNIHSNEATITMSDTCGNLLFYSTYDSNQYKIILYDKNHQLMQNGELNSCCHTGQIGCVQQPDNDSIYFIFYSHLVGNPDGKLYYAIINMNTNGGLGSIISKDNVLIDSLATEKVAITQHCNGTDFWIASKKKGNYSLVANELYVWRLTSTGLNLTPIISSPGSIGWDASDGHFRFSPDGSMAATTYNYDTYFYRLDSSYVEIYQFDNCTGIFSAPITIPFPYPYGITFSPDNSKLYIGCLDCNFSGYLKQYDVSNYNQSIVLASEVILVQGTVYNNFQMGMDGKIYVQDIDTSLVDNGSYSIGVINNPNILGFACNYVPEQINMLGKEVMLSFPCFPDNYFSNLNYVGCATSVNENERGKIVAVYPNPFEYYINIHYTESYYLRVLDITGKLIYEQNVTSEYYQLNTSQFKNGVYILNISSKNNININQKIIKL